MRIAISGTHAAGKSSLIDVFAARHPEYACEPEPYVALHELYGESFAATPSIDDFERQLEYQIDVLARYSRGDAVIFERSPADFFAYTLCIAGNAARAAALHDAVRAALARLDLILFLPLAREVPVDVHEDEDLVLREHVDDQLQEIFFAGDYDLLGGEHPIVVEARGSLEARLETLECIVSQTGR